MVLSLTHQRTVAGSFTFACFHFWMICSHFCGGILSSVSHARARPQSDVEWWPQPRGWAAVGAVFETSFEWRLLSVIQTNVLMCCLLNNVIDKFKENKYDVNWLLITLINMLYGWIIKEIVDQNIFFHPPLHQWWLWWHFLFHASIMLELYGKTRLHAFPVWSSSRVSRRSLSAISFVIVF